MEPRVSIMTLGVANLSASVSFYRDGLRLPMLAEAIAAGATLIKQPQKVFWGGYSGYFADLDGFLWEVAHNPYSWIE
jgi:uncharacterized glyoxalase superfamily protein PhnB